MSHVDPPGGKTTTSVIVVDFLKSSAAAATGGLACWLNAQAFRSMLRQNMVTGAPALTFAALFIFANRKGLGEAKKIVKTNGKTAFDRWQRLNQIDED